MPGPIGAKLLGRAARRYGPAIASAAYRRWQAMSPEEKERYRRQMRMYAERGRDMATGAAGRVRRRPDDPPGAPLPPEDDPPRGRDERAEPPPR